MKKNKTTKENSINFPQAQVRAGQYPIWILKVAKNNIVNEHNRVC